MQPGVGSPGRGMGEGSSSGDGGSGNNGNIIEGRQDVGNSGVAAAGGARRAGGDAAASAGGQAAISGSQNANAERGGSSAGPGQTTSLYEAMRAPGAQPDVHVIAEMPSDLSPNRKDTLLDPREDLWLTTFDGRFNSDIVPIHVGIAPNAKTFTVHKHVLEKADFFRKALSGHFRESETQIINLPEDDPAIFHHVVAFLYEGRYEPIKPIASELIPDADKGKGREPADRMDSDSDSADSILSNSTARSRRRRERRRRREDRVVESMRQKHPGLHRPNCNCPQCLVAGGSPCWNCNAPRHPPAPGPPAHVLRAERERERHRNRRYARRNHDANVMGVMNPAPPGALGVVGGMRPGSPPLLIPPGSTLSAGADPNGGRIKGEDMRTWLLTYELNLDVYICANKFVMDDFKRAVARASIDMLESAGSDAAHPRVLQLCRRLYDGLGTDLDPLLRMIFARMGFLQPAFARGPAAEEASDFLLANPDIVALILRETTNRREEDGPRALPSMERHYPHLGGPGLLTPGSIFDGGPFGPNQGRPYYIPPRPPRFP